MCLCSWYWWLWMLVPKAWCVIIAAWIMFGGDSKVKTMVWLAWAWMEQDKHREYSQGTTIRHHSLSVWFWDNRLVLKQKDLDVLLWCKPILKPGECIEHDEPLCLNGTKDLPCSRSAGEPLRDALNSCPENSPEIAFVDGTSALLNPFEGLYNVVCYITIIHFSWAFNYHWINNNVEVGNMSQMSWNKKSSCTWWYD